MNGKGRGDRFDRPPPTEHKKGGFPDIKRPLVYLTAAWRGDPCESRNRRPSIAGPCMTRYKDIAYVAPAGNSDASYALILKNAFAILPDKLDWESLDPVPGPEPKPEEERELIPEDEVPLIIVIDELGNEAEAGEGPESSSDTNLDGNSKNSEDVEESRDANKMPEAGERPA